MSINPNGENGAFRPEQKEYLEGFFAGSRVRGIGFSETGAGSPVAEKKPAKRSKEEKIKEALHPLEAYSELRRKSREGLPPEPEDIFRFKWNGLFWLAPVHEGYMCRLRIPGGFVRADQFRVLGKLATDCASGFLQITTRNNLQIRIIPPEHCTEVLTRVVDCGLHSRGSGADNIRNITAHPSTGFDPEELIDVRPLVEDLQAVIMNDRVFYDLPRKFNISFNGAGRIPVAEDTNDIGLRAFKDDDGEVRFQILLGGVTGHQEFAEYGGVICDPEQAVDVTAAMTKVFAANGNRKSRGKARLVYLLKDWGMEKYLEETEALLGYSLQRRSSESLPDNKLVDPSSDPHAHLGVQPQKQPGLGYLGISTPVGLVQAEEVEAIAEVAERFGSGELRLTIFQNILVPDIPVEKMDDAIKVIEKAGLRVQTSRFRGGMVACTGSRYCKYSAIDTKEHAVALADFIDSKLELDLPINVHVTGCPHSCAQHYIGDIGLLGCKVETEEGEDPGEGVHVFVGGGFGKAKNLGRQILSSVPVGPVLHEKILALLHHYLAERDKGQTFQDFTTARSEEELAACCDAS